MCKILAKELQTALTAAKSLGIGSVDFCCQSKHFNTMVSGRLGDVRIDLGVFSQCSDSHVPFSIASHDIDSLLVQLDTHSKYGNNLLIDFNLNGDAIVVSCATWDSSLLIHPLPCQQDHSIDWLDVPPFVMFDSTYLRGLQTILRQGSQLSMPVHKVVFKDQDQVTYAVPPEQPEVFKSITLPDVLANIIDQLEIADHTKSAGNIAVCLVGAHIAWRWLAKAGIYVFASWRVC